MPRLTLACLRRRGYPERRPVEVDLRDTKNVPGAALRDLRAVLSKEAQQAVGEVSIHGLCAAAVDALEDLERARCALRAREAPRGRRGAEGDRVRGARARGPGQERRAALEASARRAPALAGRAEPVQARRRSEMRRSAEPLITGGSGSFNDGSSSSSSGDELGGPLQSRYAPTSRNGAFSGGAAAGKCVRS